MFRNKAYIGFGANLGHREFKFREVLQEFERFGDITIVRNSKLYETEPIGLADDGPKFVNAALEALTHLSPHELMAKLREIEIRLGKSPSHKSDLSRTVDLDLLLYGDVKFKDNDLEVPHPRMHKRGFVLVPLAEIAGDAIHPGLDCTVAELLRQISPEELKGVHLLTIAVDSEN
jgi:2-amino-4-hydroxy-6-hydroxymethyldihydropteridine diphosphokinase